MFKKLKKFVHWLAWVLEPAWKHLSAADRYRHRFDHVFIMPHDFECNCPECIDALSLRKASWKN